MRVATSHLRFVRVGSIYECGALHGAAHLAPLCPRRVCAEYLLAQEVDA
jgi:hypothetical protein